MQENGVQTVVVYSEADAQAGYVKEADEAYCIGPAPAVKSYLNIDRLIEVLKISGADAVHPGYGFLSESATFAKAVAAAGARWIGPSPEILGSIESKCFCRTVAQKMGVPITPGTVKPITTIEDIYEVAERVGLPILLKLDQGGGGKGIEKISTLEDKAAIQTVLDSMQRIGKMAFASSDVYVEKAVLSPRHIEVQFVSDDYGNVVCLGERECSIQRRYQKIVEESPSCAVSNEDRARLYSYTEKLVKVMRYSGAGTVEYLRAEDGSFYFMEINARLQVEHPVSEFVTGVDIVEQQILVASGEILKLKQDQIQLDGHAIECRIYSENPETFLPCPGTISKITFPDLSDGNIRVEHAVQEGYKITPYYDSMLFKVITWGENRSKCIENMKTALGDFNVEGVSTTICTDYKIMDNARFQNGNFTTAFLKDENFI
jgi:acetyl/propionyl-CoA carboxylase alpha subunit